jgi:hypothetical protein
VVEPGVNDVALDALVARVAAAGEAQAGTTAGGPGTGATPTACPIVQLSAQELRDQVHLLRDGLLGKGALLRCSDALR